MAAALLALAWVGAQVLVGPPIVRVLNASSVPLWNVVVTTSAGDHAFGELPPEESRCCVVDVRGESGLAVAFVAGSEPVHVEGLAYLESSGGYCESVEVDAELAVTTRWQGPGCGFVQSAICLLSGPCP